MAAKEAWGLDIGQCAIRIVKLRRNGNDFTLMDYAVEAIDTFPDDPDYNEKVEEKLGEVIKEYKIGKKPVIVSLSGFSTLFRDFPLPMISANKLDEIVSYEAKQQIPYPLEEVLWDYYQYKADEDSPEMNIALVCCRRDLVDGLLSTLEDLNLNIKGIQVGPIALANFLMYDQSLGNGSLILDCGARATEFLVINNDSFWHRSISVAGNEMSKVLMKKFNLSYSDAEDLKMKMGESKQADRVFDVVKPVMKTLAGEITRSMGYYKSLYRGVNVKNVSASAGLFKIPGMDQFVADEIGLPVSRLASLEYIALDNSIDEDEFSYDLEYLGTAIGLALQGVGEVAIDINLLPEEVKRRHVISEKFPLLVVSVLLIIVATALSFMSAKKQSTRWAGLNGNLDKIVGSNGTTAKAISKLKAVNKKFEPEEKKNIELGSEAANRGDIAEVIPVILKKVNKINQERQQAVRGTDEEKTKAKEFYKDVLANDDAVKEFLKTIKNKKAIKGLKELIKKSVKIKAKRIVDRRRKVIVEKIEAESVREPWYQLKEKGDEVGPIITSTELNEMLENKSIKSKKETNVIGVYVCKLKISGFTVNSALEIRDVMGLKNEFQGIPGIIDISFVRDTSRTINKLPVIKHQYVERKDDGNDTVDSFDATDEDLKNKSSKISWEVYDEPIQAFSMEIKYLPSKTMKRIMSTRDSLSSKKIRSSAASDSLSAKSKRKSRRRR